jgi:hypothetical protein
MKSVQQNATPAILSMISWQSHDIYQDMWKASELLCQQKFNGKKVCCSLACGISKCVAGWDVGGLEYMCDECSSTWRGQACSWTDHSNAVAQRVESLQAPRL